MSARCVIEAFDEVEDYGAGQPADGKIPAIDQLPLEGSTETVCGGIVVVAFAAHGGEQSAWASACRKSAAAYWTLRSEWQRAWVGGCRWRSAMVKACNTSVVSRR